MSRRDLLEIHAVWLMLARSELKLRLRLGLGLGLHLTLGPNCCTCRL